MKLENNLQVVFRPVKQLFYRYLCQRTDRRQTEKPPKKAKIATSNIGDKVASSERVKA